MLHAQQQNARWRAADPQQSYNELILDEAAYEAALPGAVDAVFYIPAGSCHSKNWAAQGSKCERYARAFHRRLAQRYGLPPERLPLLRLDLQNWQTPFALAE